MLNKIFYLVFLSGLSIWMIGSCSYSAVEDLDDLTYDPHHTSISVKIDGKEEQFSNINSETRDHGEISRLSVINSNNTRYIELMWKMKEDHKHFDFGSFPEVHYVYFKGKEKFEYIQAPNSDMHNINLYHDDKRVLHFKGEITVIPLNEAAKKEHSEPIKIFLDLQKGYDG